MQHELLTQYENQLLEKEHSGCHALLRDDKVWKAVTWFLFSLYACVDLYMILANCLLQVEDLSRMYRLFFRIPKGLEPVSHIFKLVSLCHLSSYSACAVRSLLIHLLLLFIQHVTEEGTALVKHAEDAASNKKVLSIGRFFFVEGRVS